MSGFDDLLISDRPLYQDDAPTLLNDPKTFESPPPENKQTHEEWQEDWHNRLTESIGQLDSDIVKEARLGVAMISASESSDPLLSPDIASKLDQKVLSDLNNDIPKRKINAVIFDLDGTLLDTEPLSTTAIDMAIGRWGKSVDWALKSRMVGLRDQDWAQMVIDTHGLHQVITPTQLVDEWHHNMALLLPGVQLLPGVLSVIKKCAALSIPMAVATSSTAEAVRLKRAGRVSQGHEDIFEYFSVVVTGDDPELRAGKPAPDIFLLAAARLSHYLTKQQGNGVSVQLVCDSVLVFEDSPSGVAAAVAAGMPVVAVPDARMQRHRFSSANQVLDSLSDFEFSHWHFESLIN